jgi:hypothetical protein
MKEFIFGLLLGIGLTLSVVKVREKLEEPSTAVTPKPFPTPD